jgi:dipeptidyl aminopeptidase/acylaminoacyl peptidase
MTESPTARPLPCGTWPSPIAASDVAEQQRQVSFPLAIAGEVWWQELLPGEHGRTTVMRLGADGQRRNLLPAPWNARTTVHEYGGRSYLPVPADAGPGQRRWAMVFANYADQRLYLVDEPGPDGAVATPRPLTPAPVADQGTTSLRYADLVLSPNGAEVWCVQERHEDTKVTRAIVAVPLDGAAAANGEAIRQLVSGADFYAFPTPSPDGGRLAWISWNHPRMPWDGTELRVATVEDGVPGKAWLVKGGTGESVLAPLWRDATSLYLVSDWPGWWNLYEVDLAGGPAEAVYPAEEEFAGPLWQLGDRPYAVLSDGRLAVLHGCGGMRLGLLDPATAELTDLDIPYRVFTAGLSADGTSVVGVAGGPSTPASLIRVDAETGKARKLYSATARPPASWFLPKPRRLQFDGKFGQTVHAWVYSPANPDAVVPEGERPPYVVWAHGGPAAHAGRLLDLEKAYFTSRGIGIIDVNYGGSTGYGRGYRERLRGQWGVLDVEDVIAAARALIESGDADPARLAIRGFAAGGWTALAAVTTHAKEGVFKAAVSYSGVADLRGFAARTHDFESHYLDGLIGPLPGFQALYAERSPVGHVSGDTVPVLLLQGEDDPVVLPSQAHDIARQLKASNIHFALLEFQGESHGFRRAETVARALESELSFYAQVLGFTPPGIPTLKLQGIDYPPAPEAPEPPPAPRPAGPAGQPAEHAPEPTLPAAREPTASEQPSPDLNAAAGTVSGRTP